MSVFVPFLVFSCEKLLIYCTHPVIHSFNVLISCSFSSLGWLLHYYAANFVTSSSVYLCLLRQATACLSAFYVCFCAVLCHVFVLKCKQLVPRMILSIGRLLFDIWPFIPCCATQKCAESLYNKASIAFL